MPNIHWTDNHDSSTTASSRSNGSERSYRSKSTAPTDRTECSENANRPSLKSHQHETCYGRIEGRDRPYPVRVYNEQQHHQQHQHQHQSIVSASASASASATATASVASVNTYASTSEEDLDDDDDEDDCFPQYEVPVYAHSPEPADAVPATPRDFADHFPSSKRLTIRHDDTTIDGNMNLRLDTQVETRRGKKLNLTLFHLRMHDLRSREFSLRRYCRDSGREVCHSIRKYQKPPSERPALQRSFSSALAPFSRLKTEARPQTSAGLKRSDSGYASVMQQHHQQHQHQQQTYGEEESRPKSEGRPKARQLLPTNTVKLEFSNYAHVDIKRRGAKSSKRYVFEYWDVHYTWKRSITNEGGVEYVSYHLYRDGCDEVLAYILPIQMSPAQRHEELARGGWIPPCHLRLCDDTIINAVPDVSDVIVSSGLIALVDDCIKRHFHPKQTVQLHIPISRSSSLKLNMESIGPRRLIDEMFNRNNNRKATQSPPHSLNRRVSAV